MALPLGMGQGTPVGPVVPDNTGGLGMGKVQAPIVPDNTGALGVAKAAPVVAVPAKPLNSGGAEQGVGTNNYIGETPSSTGMSEAVGHLSMDDGNGIANNN